MSVLTADEENAFIDAVAYNAFPTAMKVVKARKAHHCVVSADVSWGRACHPVRPGEQYVRVTMFWPWRRAPLVGAVCSACAQDCPTLPRISEESP